MKSQPPPDGANVDGDLAIGFLTVVEHAEHGLFGGYLVLNAAGRPLEFHCTTPIRPTRAQEILYGFTLRPFLYGEQIGKTLVKKARQPVALVLTDQPEAMALADQIASPVALVIDRGASPREGGPGEALIEFAVAEQRVAVTAAHVDDRERIADRLTHWAQRIDLSEPFERIRQAIAEAQKSAA